MTRICLLLTFFFSTPSSFAQVRDFPYKAKVVAKEVYTRSGGGEAFYPTQLLKRDTVVTVRRHDPGGWYMIDPPEGSFSWIPEKYVRQTGAATGEVNESNVVVFVGSTFGDETHVWQRKMMAGETVDVIGQREVDTLTGPKRMLKIQPPAREFRWVPGSALIPVSEADRAAHDRNPWAEPSYVAEQRSRAERPERPQPGAPESARPDPSNRLTKLARIRKEQQRLHEVDQKFRNMLLSDPSAWDLQKIEKEYLRLQETLTHKPLSGQIDLRYPAIDRYRRRKVEYDDLQKLTSATEKRDAELMSAQYGFPQDNVTANSGGAQGVAAVPPLSTATAPVPDGISVAAAAPPFHESMIAPPAFNSASAPDATPPTPPATSGVLNIPVDSKYIGAGLLQRSTNETSDYVLTSPQGRILAHLKTKDDSVDLDSFVGRSVGLKGSRWFDDRVKSDYIEVSGLEEVRIRQ